jgi:hypothetical protein
MDDDLERIWKEAVIIPTFVWMAWGKPWKSSVRIAGVPAEIRIENLPNTSQKRNRLSQLSRL